MASLISFIYRQNTVIKTRHRMSGLANRQSGVMRGTPQGSGLGGLAPVFHDVLLARAVCEVVPATRQMTTGDVCARNSTRMN